jgi:predicted DsbA family dithiol-disulfide isomerase
VRIDVWSDIVCPWCYLGKHRFERALATFPHRDEVEVVYRSFQLDPRAPREPRRHLDVLAAKYGMSEQEARARQAQLEKVAAAEGVELHLADGEVGNTFDAHRLIHLAKERGVQHAAVERLFRAHFTEQRSVFDRESLAALGAEAGLELEEARAVLAGDAYADAVAADLAEAMSLGIGGVPFYAFDMRLGVSGAQPPELFQQVLERARENPVSESA